MSLTGMYMCTKCLTPWDESELGIHGLICPHCGGECERIQPPPLERELTGIERTLGQ